MPTTKANQKAVNKYIGEKYDRINLTVEKGWKTEITEYAQQHDESLNAFIRRAIDGQIIRDSTTDTITFTIDETLRNWLFDLAEKRSETVDNLIHEAIALLYEAKENK